MQLKVLIQNIWTVLLLIRDKLNVHVGVKNNQKIDSINPGGEKKTISGKDGFLIKEKDDGKDKYKFEYLQDGKIVKISAVSEDIISQVIA